MRVGFLGIFFNSINNRVVKTLGIFRKAFPGDFEDTLFRIENNQWRFIAGRNINAIHSSKSSINKLTHVKLKILD